MILAHVIPKEEAFVRALNGESVYGCITDLDTVWYVNLKDKRLFEAYRKNSAKCDYFYCIDSFMRIEDGDECSIPQGRYNVIQDMDNLVELTTEREFKETTKWC